MALSSGGISLAVRPPAAGDEDGAIAARRPDARSGHAQWPGTQAAEIGEADEPQQKNSICQENRMPHHTSSPYSVAAGPGAEGTLPAGAELL